MKHYYSGLLIDSSVFLFKLCHFGDFFNHFTKNKDFLNLLTNS